MAQVPSTIDEYTGDGAQTDFVVTFDYLSQAFVFVEVDGVNTPFTWLNDALIQITPAPILGAAIKVYRNTAAINIFHEFDRGVPFLPRYVDENNEQLLHAVQESINDTADRAAEALEVAEDALEVAEEARDIAQEASDKVDAAVIESAHQLRLDLANGVDPLKGAEMVALSTGITVRDALYARAEWVPSMAALKLLPGTAERNKVFLQSWHADLKSIGSGFFYWDAADTTAADDATVVQVTGVPTGRWRRIYDKLEVNVAWYGARGDGSNDWEPIQRAMNTTPWPIRLFGHHKIDKPLDFGTLDAAGVPKATLLGQETQKSFDVILETLPGFAGFSMLRNWRSAWYAVAEPESSPPADLAPYEGRFSRYCNVSGIRFIVNGAQTNRINCIDFVAQHEGSIVKDCFFLGNTAQKGTPLRSNSTGTAPNIGINVWRIRDCTIYDSWFRQLDVLGGGDLTVENLTTTKEVCDEVPIRVQVLQAKFRGVHCETYAVGKSTVEIQARGFSWVQGWISVRNGQGNVFHAIRQAGASTFFCHPHIQDIFIYPEGANWANVTNQSSIMLVHDAITTTETHQVPLVSANQGLPTYLYEYSFNRLSLGDVDGNQRDKTMAGMHQQRSALWNAATPLDIPYIAADGTGSHGCIVQVTGRNGTNNNPFIYQGWIGVSASNTRGVANLVNQNVAGTISFNFNVGTGRYTLATTDATGMNGCHITILGPTRWQSMQF